DDEPALISRAQGGDGEAVSEILIRHRGRIQRLAHSIVRNPMDAEEVVQDVMMTIANKIDRFRGDANLTTWIHRIAVNAALMKLRSMRRRPEQSIEPLLPQFAEDGHRVGGESRWSEQADVAAERAETRQMVRDKIDELPEDYRTVLLLRDIEQLDTQQTAELLDVSTSVVKTRLHRARQALRALLDPHLSGASA
ncbi:MAG: sigma-70 family RNA polymerase sigma factor, partial [Phycisphaeraceae bacterium]|nr:sigma-70 family RNA polymerase sigma factor [Phycisphaeraceae bacterium]